MIISTLLPLAEVWAASSAGAEEHAASITQLIFPAINFLIFLYLLKRYLMPFVKNHLRSRREEIAEAVGGAAAAKKQAEETVRACREQVARLDQTTKEILQTLRAEGDREKTKLLAEAEELADRIKTDADFLADQEVKGARQQVRYEIGRIAQEAAERALQHQLTSADQERLIGDFLVQVRESR